eukprot:c16519_g1_i1 orf=133-462(+)
MLKSSLGCQTWRSSPAYPPFGNDLTVHFYCHKLPQVTLLPTLLTYWSDVVFLHHPSSSSARLHQIFDSSSRTSSITPLPPRRKILRNSHSRSQTAFTTLTSQHQHIIEA